MGNFLIAISLATGLVTTGRFAVDGASSTANAVVATVQPRTAAPGYSWLRVFFYSSAPAADRAKGSRADDLTRTNWSAVVQVTVDKAGTVWQVDVSLPGHTCTIAESDREARAALPMFQFDGRRLRLQGRGTHVCDGRALRIPSQTFEWDIDVDVPVANVTP